MPWALKEREAGVGQSVGPERVRPETKLCSITRSLAEASIERGNKKCNHSRTSLVDFEKENED